MKSSSDLHSINALTGAASFILSLDQLLDNALAFDSDGTLYGIRRVANDTELYTIDVGTGATAFIGLMGVAKVSALAFQPAPEPTTLALMGLGLAGLGYRRHRSKIAA